MDTREYMRNLLWEQRARQELELREQEAKQQQELREQESKRLEVEHLAETRKFKEEQHLITVPPDWLSEDPIGGDVDQIKPDMIAASNSQDGEDGLLKL